MRKKWPLVFMIVLCLLLNVSFCVANPLAGSPEEINIYVSLSGKDSSSGSIDDPIRSFDAVKSMIQKYKLYAESREVELNIIFRQGVYHINGDAFSIGSKESGDDNFTVNFKAYPGEKVVFSGGSKLDTAKFELLKDEKILSRLPAEARGKVYCTNLAQQGIKDYGSMTRTQMELNQDGTVPSHTILNINDEMLTIAEWPNITYTHIESVLPSDTGHAFTIKDYRMSRWTDVNGVVVYGTMRYEWRDDTLNVAKIDPVNRAVYTSNTSYYGLDSNANTWIKFINILDELDVPGEWYVDVKTGMLYVYPKTNIYDSTAEFVSKTTPIISVVDAKNIHFSGFTFENTRGNAVEIIDSDSITISNSEFKNIGTKAVWLKNVYNCGISYCNIHDVGKGGLRINGGDRSRNNLKLGNNYVENCNIERYSLVGTKASDAVLMFGAGNRVSHNRISNASHRAIHWEGFEMTVEYNDIYNVIKETPDMGAIYFGGFSNCGSEIKYNYIHDINAPLYSRGGRPAIYNDDFSTGTKNIGNVIYNANIGIRMHSNMYVEVKNNLIIDTKLPIEAFNIDNVSNERVDKMNAVTNKYIDDGSVYENYSKINFGYDKATNIVKQLFGFTDYVNNDVKLSRYPYLKNLLSDGILFSSKYNTVRGNYFVNSGEMSITGKMPETSIISNNIYDDGVSFIQDDNGNMTKEKYDEVCSRVTNFKPISLDDVGITGEMSLKLNKFNLIFPVNNSENIQADDVTLAWEDKSGATKYRLVVAKDKEFKDVVYDDIVESNFKRFTGLRYGRQVYYWKVQGIGTSYLYGNNNTEWNSNGVYKFRTAMSPLVDNTALNAKIIEARKEFDSAIEGDKKGNYEYGAKSSFEPYINEAENIVKLHNVSQKKIDNMLSVLSTKYEEFKGNRSATDLDMGAVISDSKLWTATTEISKNSVTGKGNGSFGYFGSMIENYHNLIFNAKYSLADNGYTSIGIRSSNVNIEPWNSKEYMFVVKKDVIELQKYNGKDKFFYSVPNTYISDLTPCKIEFGAFNEKNNEKNSVRIILKVDGREVFNQVDESGIITQTGGFHVYNNGGNNVVISSVE